MAARVFAHGQVQVEGKPVTVSTVECRDCGVTARFKHVGGLKPPEAIEQYFRNHGWKVGGKPKEEEPFFLFFDEFDSLAAQRMDSGQNQVGEQDHNHGVNTLLANFDRYEGFIVAATNHGRRVDEAIWRRFEIQIALELPGDHERRRILERYFAPFVLPDRALAALSESLETASPALMRSFAEHIKRQIVVGPKAGWAMDRAAVISRVIETVKPHPDLGLPRLWSLGLKDKALDLFPWPLERSADAYPAPAAAPEPAEPGASVVAFKRGGGR